MRASIEVTADAPRTLEQAKVIVALGVAHVLINAPAVPTPDLPEALASARHKVLRMLLSADAKTDDGAVAPTDLTASSRKSS